MLTQYQILSVITHRSTWYIRSCSGFRELKIKQHQTDPSRTFEATKSKYETFRKLLNLEWLHYPRVMMLLICALFSFNQICPVECLCTNSQMYWPHRCWRYLASSACTDHVCGACLCVVFVWQLFHWSQNLSEAPFFVTHAAQTILMAKHCDRDRDDQANILCLPKCFFLRPVSLWEKVCLGPVT